MIDVQSFLDTGAVHRNGVDGIAHPNGVFEGFLMDISPRSISRSAAHVNLVAESREERAYLVTGPARAHGLGAACCPDSLLKYLSRFMALLLGVVYLDKIAA